MRLTDVGLPHKVVPYSRIVQVQFVCDGERSDVGGEILELAKFSYESDIYEFYQKY